MSESTTTGPVPFKANWKEQKEKLILKFPSLTDTDLRFENGKKDEMLERIQIKLGKTKDELAEIISAL